MGLDAVILDGVENIYDESINYFNKMVPFLGSFKGIADVTISVDTTWSIVEYPNLIAKVKKLTINSGIRLTIAANPFVIYCDELNFEAVTSIIDASGPSGADSGTFDSAYARGGTRASGAGRAQGGCGGGFLIILANKITGANGVIRANGGNGYANSSAPDASATSGGEGALTSKTLGTSDFYVQIISLLGDGGRGDGALPIGGYGGGGTSANVGGGSGIGGAGNACTSAGARRAATQATNLRVGSVPLLYALGCKGGGGGAACGHTSNIQSASGGGGGLVCVLYKEATATPILEANAGTKQEQGTCLAGDSAAGKTFFMQVA